MLKNIEYSVVIPTHRRLSILKKCLQAVFLSPSKMDALEVIVVDDGSELNFNELKKIYTNVQWIHQKKSGAPQARNTGAQAARGKYLLFLDDDCLIDPTYFQELTSFWKRKEGENVGMVCGVLHGVSSSFFGKAVDYFDFYNLDEARVTKATSSNLCIRRDVFIELKGFNRFLLGAEDVDLSLRAQNLGYFSYGSSRLRGEHHHDRFSLWPLVSRAFFWSTHGETHLKLIYPEKLIPSRNRITDQYKKYFISFHLKRSGINAVRLLWGSIFYSLENTFHLHKNNAQKLGWQPLFFPRDMAALLDC